MAATDACLQRYVPAYMFPQWLLVIQDIDVGSSGLTRYGGRYRTTIEFFICTFRAHYIKGPHECNFYVHAFVYTVDMLKSLNQTIMDTDGRARKIVTPTLPLLLAMPKKKKEEKEKENRCKWQTMCNRRTARASVKAETKQTLADKTFTPTSRRADGMALRTCGPRSTLAGAPHDTNSYSRISRHSSAPTSCDSEELCLDQVVPHMVSSPRGTDSLCGTLKDARKPISSSGNVGNEPVLPAAAAATGRNLTSRSL